MAGRRRRSQGSKLTPASGPAWIDAAPCPTSGGRQRPDGYLLSWRIATLTDPRLGDGLAPFFIDWGATEHPTVGLPGGIRLVSVRARYTDPQSVQAAFDALDIPVMVEAAAEPVVIAVLDTPRGRIELR